MGRCSSRTALSRYRAAGRQVEGCSSLPEVVDLLAGVMPWEADDVRVKAAARSLGVVEGDIADARRTGELSSTVVLRGGRLRNGLKVAEIDELASIRLDRLGRHSAARLLGVPLYGLEQIVAAGNLPQHEHAWLARRYGGPVLRRADVDGLIDRVIHYSGGGITDPVPLASALKAFGGGPKPWAAIFAMLIDGRLSSDASRRADGSLSVRIPVSAIRLLRVLPIGAGQLVYSQEDALEILNMGPKNGEALGCLPRSDDWVGPSGASRMHGQAVDGIAATRMSCSELMALSGLAFKTITRLLRIHGAAPIDRFGYDRRIALEAQDSITSLNSARHSPDSSSLLDKACP